MKTSELIGPTLDWAVTKCDQEWSDDDALLWIQDDEYPYHPSTYWSQGGPIIERELIHITRSYGVWKAAIYLDHQAVKEQGTTPLIAAMRCYVASRLGDEVEIPEELL